MPTIYLMRHGHVDNPQQVFYGPEFPLSEQGRQNIRDLVGDMRQAGLSPTRVIASPFTRTHQTAEIAAEMFGISRIEMDDRLREWDVGTWFNKSLVEFNAVTGYYETPPRISDPSIETLQHMADRVIDVFHDALKQENGDSVLIISHREPLVSSILRLQHLPWDGIHQVSFPRACVWEASFDEHRAFSQARKRFDRHVS